jgi:hypothetical protein
MNESIGPDELIFWLDCLTEHFWTQINADSR